MRRRVTTPELYTPILVVVVVMSILFGLVQRVARHIDVARSSASAHLLSK